MRRVLLFAEPPVLGQVKTRLVAKLGADGALALYRAFLLDQLRFLRSFEPGFEVELCVDGPFTPDPEIATWTNGLRIRPQGPGDLGRRMLAALQRSWQEGARHSVILGVDAPTLPASHVHEASDLLDGGVEVAIAPSHDGGYVLLGLRDPLAELFRDVPWGDPTVFRVTLARAAACGAVTHQLARWYDVDDADDLRRLRQDLALPGAEQRAPATAELLSRS